MYHYKEYDYIIAAVFADEITIEDVKTFSQDIEELTQAKGELFIITFAIDITSYPTNISQLLKSLKLMQGVMGRVKRLYGIQLNPIISFLSNTVTQLIRLKTNTIEARDRQHMFEIVRREAQQSPKLQESIHHLDSIEEYIDSYTIELQNEA